MLAGTEHVEVGQVDLADRGSIAAFAQRLLASGRGIDVLVNDAGIVVPRRPTSRSAACRWSRSR